MTRPASPLPSQDLAFFATPAHECPYIRERQAITLFADPYVPMSMPAYSALAELGFRRSGDFVYRPRCEGCDACVSVRIPVAAFQPNRSQRRTWERNQDVDVFVRPPAFEQEHFELYRRYTGARHAGGGMDTDRPEQYRQFLLASWCNSRFVEFRTEGRLLAVAVIDCLKDGLSAVYTFYDPEETSRGLGTLAVLWQVSEARRLGLDGVYLGYWIKGSAKMDYKTRFQPLEGFVDGRWRPVSQSIR